MTDQRWDTWIDWDNANGAAMDLGRYEPGSVALRHTPESDRLQIKRLTDLANVIKWPPNTGPRRFVLPILGCGNDP